MSQKKITYQDIKNIYFIGIGGIGMSALARYFNTNGKRVVGYDKNPSPITDKLLEEGISIHFEDDIEKLDPSTDLVVYTPAIPKNHKQYNWYLDKKYELQKRSYVLGMITKDSFCIAVAGSHGKTTVSSMIAHLLNETIGCTAFLGGIVSNFDSNFIHTNNDIIVVEADEYDRSFMSLKPNITVITSVDSDHLDIYENYENIVKEFQEFAQLVDKEGVLIEHSSVEPLNLNTQVSSLSYSLNDGQVEVLNYNIVDGKFLFDIDFFFEEIKGFELHLAGKHNMENALAAIAVAKSMNISNRKIKRALARFKGIYRRFEKRAENHKTIYIDDYAHHPNELKALLESVLELYPDREIVAVFQPHLYTRTRDLASEFAQQLSLAHEVFLLPIYPARELAIAGVSSQIIYDKIDLKKKNLVSKENLLEQLAQNLEKRDNKNILLSIGAGDIDRFIEPIISMIRSEQ